MSHPNPSTALARVVIDELVRGGVTEFVASPGSRSTALVLAASSHPGVELVVAIDERSAAFNAVGRAKATGCPAAVITTSGTAVANLVPAVVEADMSNTPLVVLTADRPVELRGVGANQAIDQFGIFSNFVRYQFDAGIAESRPAAPGWWRSIVSQVLGAAMGFAGRPGPAHLNLPFREPTVSVSDDGRTRDEPFDHPTEGREEQAPWSRALIGRGPDAALVKAVSSQIERAERGIILAGGGKQAPALIDLGGHLGWPVLATAESGLRALGDVIATGHHLVSHVRPDLVLRFGTPGPSNRLLNLLESPVPQVVVGSQWSDPGRRAELMVDADPQQLAEALLQDLAGRSSDGWLEWWRLADRAVRTTFEPELTEVFGEPGIAAVVAGVGSDQLTIASSMPIRDIEAYGFQSPPVIANRGASGIDGFVSLALGAASSAQRPLALSGDLSFLHDTNGFLLDPPGRSVFVVVDNGGGGIFSFLPQATHAGEDFERLFGTPHRRDLAEIAEFHRLRHTSADSLDSLRKSIEEAWDQPGSVAIIVQTDRQANLDEHDRLARLADEAVRSVAASG